MKTLQFYFNYRFYITVVGSTVSMFRRYTTKLMKDTIVGVFFWINFHSKTEKRRSRWNKHVLHFEVLKDEYQNVSNYRKLILLRTQ